MGPSEGVLICSGIIAIVAAIAAILSKNLIHAVIAFAVSSAALACLFFILASPYAGVFELTVGAGLVAVLFLVAMILAGGWDGEGIV